MHDTWQIRPRNRLIVLIICETIWNGFVTVTDLSCTCLTNLFALSICFSRMTTTNTWPMSGVAGAWSDLLTYQIHNMCSICFVTACVTVTSNYLFRNVGRTVWYTRCWCKSRLRRYTWLNRYKKIGSENLCLKSCYIQLLSITRWTKILPQYDGVLWGSPSSLTTDMPYQIRLW